MHCFVHYMVFCTEPVVDAAERGEHVTADSGFFGDFACRGLLCLFTDFDMTFRQRPAYVAMTVGLADNYGDLGFAVKTVDDQPTG